MKVGRTSASELSSGGERHEPATPRSDRLQRSEKAGLPATRPTAGGIPRSTQTGPDTHVDGAGAPRSHGRREERSREDLEGEPETHGRIGCLCAGNSSAALRTRRWSKALKSAAPRQTWRARRTSNGRRIGQASRASAPRPPRWSTGVVASVVLWDGVDSIHGSRVTLGRATFGSSVPRAVASGPL